MTRTVGAALSAAAATLAAAGIPDPRFEARLLAAHALGVSAGTLIGHDDRPVDPAAALRLDAMVARRAAREPVAYILGRREFWSLDLAVTPATLIPRPDSETLVDAALASVADRAAPCRVLDLGTGSGCLLLAVLSELPGATGLGIDIDAGAVAVARDNAARLGLAARASFRTGAWAAGVDESFDMVLSNPPYIARAAIDALEPDVALYEPRRALDGGADGLDAYRAIVPDLPRLVRAGGIAVLEIGADQAAAVAALVDAAGLGPADVRRDLAGRPRCIISARVKG